MTSLIEDYALIGDCHGAGLVSKTGSIDWLCVPRFDSPAAFAALLGTPENGRWLLTPKAPIRECRRRYRPGTLVLETEFVTDEGTVRVVDCMPPHSEAVDLVRVVEGVSGRVRMHYELTIRFDYGSVIPWMSRDGNSVKAVAGPDMLHIHSPTRTVLWPTVPEEGPLTREGVTEERRSEFVSGEKERRGITSGGTPPETANKQATRRGQYSGLP